MALGRIHASFGGVDTLAAVTVRINPLACHVAHEVELNLLTVASARALLFGRGV